MRFYSTNNLSSFVDLKEAVLNSLPKDRGLYMPEYIPELPQSFYNSLPDLSFQEISFIVANSFLNGSLDQGVLKNIIENAINFDAPLVELDNNHFILELFHGPSLAFKDFGARFMANLMSHFNQDEKDDLTILVATSGDTGGAVASGFFNIPGIKVVILYPAGKVSDLQELQLTSNGNNIFALEVEGTFDDCQSLVKSAFTDIELNSSFRFSSANSINISRLLPQCFYYFYAFKNFSFSDNVVFSVPSGNFGNLTAGLIAKRMGLPIKKFIAATNINDVIPLFLKTGKYSPKKSISTISNAMDVGNPSNFVRILDLYSSTWNKIKIDILGFSFSDKETKSCIHKYFNKYNYILDPHCAVGMLSFDEYLKSNPDYKGVVLGTAHPSKFKYQVEEIIGTKLTIPNQLSSLIGKKKIKTRIPNDFEIFKSLLFSIL